ncbi:MAG: ATP-binding protein [Atopobiaceae bacterium]|nr:ATP-binding protein [Atopobiaceae bacterium]
MLERKATSRLLQWKRDKTNQALIVTGARQVGKTTLVRNFAKESYSTFAEVNFYDNMQAVDTVNSAMDANDFLLRISALSRTEFTPGNTLIFLDEVQECGDALTWLKFLVERYDYDFVLSGSLLGLDSFDTRSLPVGFLQEVQMFPLDFEEFCWAHGVTPSLLEEARNAASAKSAIPDYLHALLTEAFYKYLLVGGMPDAVQAFVTSSNLPAVRNAQQAILDMYRYDIAKYVDDKIEKRQIRMVFDAIPAQLNQTNKRFKYTRLGKNLRFANLETAFDWLEAAGVAIVTPRISEPVFSLGASEDLNSLKLYTNDVGLLTSQLAPSVDLDILNYRSAINFGSIFENVAAQELRAHGLIPRYYNTKGIGELDFVLENRTGGITLCEVKSGKDYQRHRALNKLLETKNYRFANAYVFHDGNVTEKGQVTYLPAYCLGLVPMG